MLTQRWEATSAKKLIKSEQSRKTEAIGDYDIAAFRLDYPVIEETYELTILKVKFILRLHIELLYLIW